MEKKNRQEGPGQLFLELQQGIGDQTLNVTTYSFNAAENPSLNPEEAHWAALLCNIHYKPFLASRFPDGKWYWLGKDEAWNYGGLMLGIIPIHEENKAVFKKWNVVNLKFREVTSLILHSSLYGPKDYIVRELLKSKQLVTGDPFLESCLHERLLFSLKMGGPIDPLIIIQDELKLGYPLPTFLCAEGILLSARGDFAEAKAAFQKAARSPLNLTPAADYLKALGSMPKSRPKALSSGIIPAFP
ncbi:MAG TPA: hypothetical protein VMV05_09780 [bacterium]|nr:hypothetical protein [bacterium]